MSAILNFDATNIAPDTGSQDALPAGWYDVMMEASEMKPTKDGTGAYLETKFNVIAPPDHAGKKVYARLNLRNQNATAQEIAYKQLSAICHAVGVLQVADSAQLHNLPLKVKLKLRKADGEYEANNEITAFKNINEKVALANVGGFPPAAGGFAAPPAFSVPTQPVAPPMYAPQAPQQAPQQAWQQPQAPQPWQAPQQASAPAQQMAAPPIQQAQAPQYAPPAPPAWNPAAQPVQQAPQQPVANPAVPAAQGATPPWMVQPPQS
jgi:hypothetical protein